MLVSTVRRVVTTSMLCNVHKHIIHGATSYTCMGVQIDTYMRMCM